MTDRYEKLHKINYLTSEVDALYHRASVKLGVSDSISIILYMVYENGGQCPLSELYKRAGLSKQTVNSALRKLEGENIVRLDRLSGRRKTVCLTETGEEYVQKTVARMHAAECRALEHWSDEEIDCYLTLIEKHIRSFAEEFKTL